MFAIWAMVLALRIPASAQQPKKNYHLGYISGRSGLGNWDEVFKSSLRELGYIEGINLTITYRWAEEKLDRFPALAKDLVDLRPDVIVTETTPGHGL